MKNITLIIILLFLPLFVLTGCGEANIGINSAQRVETIEYDGRPAESYTKTYILLPQNADYVYARAVAQAIWDLRWDLKFTLGTNLDDAGLGVLLERRIVVLDPESRGGKNKLQEFYAKHYPGVKIAFVDLPVVETSSEDKAVSFDIAGLSQKFVELFLDANGPGFELIGENEYTGTIREPFERIYVLLHENLGVKWTQVVFNKGWNQKQYTMGNNPHDAGLGLISKRRIIVPNPMGWLDYKGYGQFRNWLEDHYPSHEYFPADVRTPLALLEYLHPDVSSIPVGEFEPWVFVDLTNQKLSAYIGHEQQFETVVRTGSGSKTPVGDHCVRVKYEKRDMGCRDGYDYCLRQVHWVQYFTWEGHGLHAAYAENVTDWGGHWNNRLGQPGNLWAIPGTHGCVNIPYEYAEKLYKEIGYDYLEGRPEYIGNDLCLPQNGKIYPGMLVRIRYNSATNSQDNAKYKEDVNIQDGCDLSPGTNFVKKWVLVNAGETTWKPGEEYSLQFVKDQRYCPGAVLYNNTPAFCYYDHVVEEYDQLTESGSKEVKPNEWMVWPVPMQAPQEKGRYTNCWQMHRYGLPFGDVIWVDIEVRNPVQHSCQL